MKIALVRYSYTPFGGAERYMSRLIEGLCAEGHEVHVFAAAWDTVVETNVTIHRVPVLTVTGWLKALTFSINSHKLIKLEQPDIVFSLERTLHQDIYRAGDGCHRQWLSQKNLGKGLLLKAWTWLNPLQLAYIWLERRMFTNLALKAIIANSEGGKQEIVRLYGVDPARIHVIYNGIDAVTCNDQFRKSKRQELAEEFDLKDDLRLLYVGSGFRRKGVATVINAAARLDIPFRLFIVGKGRTGAYRNLAQRLGIGDRVHFTGPRLDVERFYLGCDLFLFPTLYDPFSNATLEAMAYGLPVITSRYNGVSELIRQGDNGFVLDDPLDTEAIVNCLHILKDADLHWRMGESAAETASSFTMQRNVMETLMVIRSVCSDSDEQ